MGAPRGMPAKLLRWRPVAGALARVLPPPRDRALIGLIREFWHLVTGRGPTRPQERAAYANPLHVLAARTAVVKGDTRGALERAQAILHDHPFNEDALDVERMALGRLGEYTGAVRASGRLRLLRDSSEIASWERRMVGRLRETDARWHPRVAGPPRPVEPADPNRILHLLKESLPYAQNGYTMRSHYSLVAQRQAGLDPVVVTSLGFPRWAGITDVPAEDVVDGIRHVRLDAGPDYRADQAYDRILTDQTWLAAQAARAVRPAIVHAGSGYRGYETALVGLALRAHLRRPLVYEVRSFLETTWSPDPQAGEDAEYFRRRSDTESRSMRAADAVITIAAAMRDEIIERGVDPERVHVIPNAVDADAFTPRPPDPELRDRLGLTGNAVIGYVSTLDHPREGHEVLIEATARLLGEGRAVRCLIVGGGARRVELERLAGRLGIGHAVVFTGAVPHDRVADHYALIDVFVVPRRDERAARLVTPLKPFEAMAMARPLVVADLPALVEIAAPDERGLTFRAEDPAALAASVGRLLDEPDLAREMGRRSREWVVRERTWAANGRRYRAIYESLLASWDGTGEPARAAMGD